MLRLFERERTASGRWTRREWLRLSTWAALLPSGLKSVSGVSRGSESSNTSSATLKPAGFGRAKSVLLVFTSGGQSQLDTWDPKPDAPAEVRGAFHSIESVVPGLRISEHMPRIAKVLDRCTVVRSMTHADTDHGSACYLTLTGQYHRKLSSNPPPDPTLDAPTMGAVLRRVRPGREFPYDAIHINGPAQVPLIIAPGQDGGYLGRRYEPMVLGDVSQQRVAMPSLERQEGLSLERLSSRQSLREVLDRASAQASSTRAGREMDQLYGQAFTLLQSDACRRAFDLSAENQAIRERYGLNRSGQACLLGRRLIEAGVPLVTVIWNHNNRGQDSPEAPTDAFGWDTHNDIFDALQNRLLPRFDQGFSALIEDMDRRGLLDTTLVICLGEFGRAPLVAYEAKFAGASPGRKHWARGYSIVMAGAGVRRGSIFGASDKLGAAPASDPVAPWDVTATVFAALGIDPSQHYTDPLGRPFPISTGRPIAGIYG